MREFAARASAGLVQIFSMLVAQISEAAVSAEFLRAEFKFAARVVFLAETASKFRLTLSCFKLQSGAVWIAVSLAELTRAEFLKFENLSFKIKACSPFCALHFKFTLRKILDALGSLAEILSAKFRADELLFKISPPQSSELFSVPWGNFDPVVKQRCDKRNAECHWKRDARMFGEQHDQREVAKKHAEDPRVNEALFVAIGHDAEA